jgi:hypothetical protein
MTTCPHCGITTGVGKRHQPLSDGRSCPNAGRRSVPYDQRTEAGKEGLPRFRLPRNFGERCARIVDVGLVEQATPLLDKLLEEHEKEPPK